MSRRAHCDRRPGHDLLRAPGQAAPPSRRRGRRPMRPLQTLARRGRRALRHGTAVHRASRACSTRPGPTSCTCSRRRSRITRSRSLRSNAGAHVLVEKPIAPTLGEYVRDARSQPETRAAAVRELQLPLRAPRARGAGGLALGADRGGRQRRRLLRRGDGRRRALCRSRRCRISRTACPAARCRTSSPTRSRSRCRSWTAAPTPRRSPPSGSLVCQRRRAASACSTGPRVRRRDHHPRTRRRPPRAGGAGHARPPRRRRLRGRRVSANEVRSSPARTRGRRRAACGREHDRARAHRAPRRLRRPRHCSWTPSTRRSVGMGRRPSATRRWTPSTASCRDLFSERVASMRVLVTGASGFVGRHVVARAARPRPRLCRPWCGPPALSPASSPSSASSRCAATCAARPASSRASSNAADAVVHLAAGTRAPRAPDSTRRCSPPSG